MLLIITYYIFVLNSMIEINSFLLQLSQGVFQLSSFQAIRLNYLF